MDIQCAHCRIPIGGGRFRPRALVFAIRLAVDRAWRGALFAFPLILLLSGCAAPVGIIPSDLRGAYLEINSSGLWDAEPSYHSRIVLYRYNLAEEFKKNPRTTLLALHEKAAGGDDRRDLRFALAELNFLYAEALENRRDDPNTWRVPDYFLTSAIYSYLFLLGTSREALPSPYDPRFRQACDFHNRALGKGLTDQERGEVSLNSVARRLPIGQLSLTVDTDALTWDINRFERVLRADDYRVRGFTVRNRTAGLGAPLIAVKAKATAPFGGAVPLTAFLRLMGDGSDILNGAGCASLELHPTYDEPTVMVNGQLVPLETDTTAPIAVALDNPDIWSLGLRRFFLFADHVDPRIVEIQPYEPGRIPVVFVHGTASDPVWWAEMLNTLRADPRIRERYQFWLFQYNSNRPILESSAALRRQLTQKRRQLDPEGKDPAMNHLVVVGHSQGGLLAKQVVVRTGDAIWRSLSDTPFDQVDIRPEGKELLRELMFLEPLPFVKRVIFLSTPHRGSFLAKNWIVDIFRRILRLPITVMKGAADVLKIVGQFKLPFDTQGKMPTSLDSMSPNSPVLRVLADTPIVAGVMAHSIIAIQGEEEPPQGDDGVVEYQSAHLEGVASEFIVRSDHSCQQHPLAIEEVRRILGEHLSATSLE